MESVVERFLRYVTFDTQSDEASDTCPSTEKQKALAAALVEEMHGMGIQDARMDENGYVYGTVPGDRREKGECPRVHARSKCIGSQNFAGMPDH